MKVRIYKAPDGKGKLVKAQNGMAFNIDKEIKKKIAEGKDPEIIIYEMAELGLSRPEAQEKVNKYYDLLGDDEEEDEVVAPYDDTVEDEVAEVVEEEEPNNAAIYDYYGGDNQGLAVVNDGADEDDEDDDVARYGGQYAEGGQFAPGSIIPKPKKPYYIGMDAEPYDNAYKFGGLTKGAYVKQRIKELRKAAQGEQVQNSETNISPIGTIDSPAGISTPGKNLASIIKQTGNEAVMKQQAENEYQQYQNSTMGQDFNGKFLFGGRNRKIKRANRAMFGTPIAIPGVDVNYEFGPLGGLRKAEANWDLDAIGDLAKLLPGAMNMMPGMFPGMMPGAMSYKKVSYPAQVRKKTVSTINNAALDDVAKQNPNSTAAQNNRSDKKNEISCPPGSVYDPSLGHCVDQEGNMVRSIVDLPDPEELLGNPFENPNARMLNGKKTMKATGPSSSVSSTAASQSTQAPAAGGAPLQSQQGIDYEAWKYSGAKNPFSTRAGNEYWNAFSNKGYVKKSGAKDNPNTFSNEDQVWSSPVDQNKYNELWHLYNTIGPEALTPEQLNLIQQGSYITKDDQGNEYSSNDPYYRPNPDVSAMKDAYMRMNEVYGERDSDYVRKNEKLFQKEHGGFVDAANMDPNTLAKFIYGGNDYAYGGDVLPQAYDGFAGNFQKQMLDTKNRINQMGRKNPADYNPFKGNTFGKATTGVQPSGTVGNRFQPSGQPNTGTTTQGGTGTSGGGRGIMSQERSEELSRMTPEQRRAEFEKGKRDFDNWFNSGVQQQYMQMMQGRPGMGQGQFWTGRPQRLGFGLTRDFNYGTSYSPVNWQVPQGTKRVIEKAYKDTGKWYNPFDTKRIREWYADNGEEASDDLINKQGSGKNITTTNKGESGVDDERNTWKEKQQWKAHDELIASGAQMTDNIEEPPTSMKTLSTAPNLPNQLESGAPGRMQTLPASQMSPQGEQSTELQMPENQGETELQNNPFQGNAFEGNQFGTAAGVTPSENMRFTQGPNNFSPSAESINPFTGNAFGTSSTGVTGNANMSRPAAPSPTYPQPGVENPMADPKFVPTPQDYNPGSNPASIRTTSSQQGDSGYMGENDPLNQMPMAYGGYMAQGGYVPEYMAYGGYIPHAKSGITAGKPEFEDPNLIGRTVENSAYTFTPGQFATDLFSGDLSLTGLTKNWAKAFDEEKNVLNPQRKMLMSSDAATANTGQSGVGSAERKGSDLMASGNETQYGSTPGKQGYEGGLYGKKGGSINTQYAKGKVYSLTMEQIKAIEAAGGKIEYIK